MVELKDLLLRFQNLLVSGELKKSLVAEIVSSVIGLGIKTEDVEIKNGSVVLNIKPIYKNEVFRKKEEILEKLSAVLGKNPPKDIK